MTSEQVVNRKVLIGPDLNVSRTPLDKKNYRQIILSENGLKVVLVSDTLALMHQKHYEYDSEEEDSEDEDEQHHSDKNKDEDQSHTSSYDEEEDGIRKAAAALIVGAGSYHDPPYAQGIAHFLEHMLFMGTEKYKGENEFSAFLSKHSGSDNAYTELEHTLYHLEIAQEKIFEALDMFAQFFISPLMLQNSVERELNSIESEFRLSQNSDECRLEQLFCHDIGLQHAHGGKYHPLGGFSWGNIDSLKRIPEKNGVDMMQELRTFYKRHYYAYNMSLVVVAAYPLDELEKHVVEIFSGIPSSPRIDKPNEFYDKLAIQRTDPGTWSMKSHTPIKDFGMPFDHHTLGRICRVIPVKEKHSLYITWQLPPQWENWKSKPCDYISHLLGHEAKGSILSALKERSWANDCYAGVGSGGDENSSSHALFTMNFTLSEEGVSHWEDIVNFVYIYIGMLRFYCSTDSGLPEWIHEELRAIQEVSHKFEDEEAPMDLAESIAECLAPYNMLPAERLLDGDELLFEFNRDAVENIIEEYLTPVNSRVDLVSASFGRAAEFEDHISRLEPASEDTPINSINGDAYIFDRETFLEPLVEPIFGTRYWSHVIPSEIIQKWHLSREPSMPDIESGISLPPVNTFVPTKFDLKELPAEDSHHPLLFCSLKICVAVGKQKSWFPCTVNKFDKTKNSVLLIFEDGDEKWHKLDIDFHASQLIAPDFQGTLDSKSIKFKVTAIPKDGEGAILKYGDESDLNVEDGLHFPHVPPPSPMSRLPKVVHDTHLLKLWHLQDRKFKRPIAELRLQILCSGANKTPFHRACADLLAILLHDVTTEISYMASVCDLGCEIQSNDLGFGIRVHGFDDKVLALLSELLSTLLIFKSNNASDLPPNVKSNRFNACLEVLWRQYSNAGMKASKLCANVRLRCIRQTTWSSNAKRKSVDDLTVNVFMETINEIMNQISIKVLYHGNVSSKDAEDAKDMILLLTRKMNGMSSDNHPLQTVTITPFGDENRLYFPTVDSKDPNTAVEIYFQCGSDDITDRVVVDVLMQMMDEAFYDALRTKDQIGYSVSCDPRWSFGVIGMSFRVTTTCKSASEICHRIDSFLLSFREEILKMNREEFMEHIIGLAKSKLEKCDSLEEETGQFWYEIIESRYDFEVHRDEAERLRTIQKQEVLDGFDKWLNPNNPNRRKIEVCAIGISDGSASQDRPMVEDENVNDYIDRKVSEFHEKSGGKMY